MGRGPTTEYYRVLNKDYVEGTLTCLRPDTIKRVVNTDFPNVLNIEPTNRCNLKCYYCPRENASKGIGDMKWDLYTKIIDETARYKKLIMLSFHKDGESFLHPKFIDMVRYAKKKDVAKTIHLNTNALCWNEKVIEEILDSGLDDITVSIDAARRETFKKQKGADLLEKVETSVRNLLNKRNSMGLTKPFIRTKIMEFEGISKEEINEFYERWNGVADLVQVTGIHNWSGEIKDLKVTDERSEKRYPCAIMWYALVINWNGEATVCSVDWNTEIKVGNVNDQSLHQIWNSKEIKNARKSHINKDYCRYRVCKDCVVWVSVGDMADWFKKKTEFYQ